MKIDLKSFGLGALLAVIIGAIVLWNISDDFKERIKEYESKQAQYEERMDELRTDLEAKQKEAAKYASELVEVQADIDSLETILKNLPDVQDDIDNVDNLTVRELQEFFSNRYQN